MRDFTADELRALLQLLRRFRDNGLALATANGVLQPVAGHNVA